jgi:hypothetical protein
MSASLGVFLPRGPLLPAWGTRRRDWELWRWAIHDRNWLFKSAVTGLAKKIASTPFQVVGENPDIDATEAREILLGSNFGRGWRDFVMSWVWNYCTHNTLGAVVEIIGPGDPRGPIWGQPSGFSMLDTFYCYPTGNPTWPVLYWEAHSHTRKPGDHRRGAWHWMHHERVHYTVDQPVYRRRFPAAGISAADRAISIIYQQVFADAYIGENLDDRPPPAIYHTHNIDPASWAGAWREYQARLDNDFLDERGRTVTIKELQTDAPSSIEMMQFSNAPEKFDYDQYVNIFAKATAVALGVDVQELWELTGGNASLGTATQSAVLARKGEGKTEADIYAALERFTMNILPAGYQLEFEFKDSDDDEQEARIAAQNMNAASTAVASGLATTDQAARYLAMKDDTWRRVFEEPQAEVATDRDPVDEDQPVMVLRAWPDTRDEFVARLSDVFQRTHTGVRGGRRLSNSIRALLRTYGTRAYEDGFAEAGIEREFNTSDRMHIQSWLADEGQFVTSLLQGEQALRRGLPPDEARQRAEAWANKSLRALYQTALMSADGENMLTWVLDPFKENCRTCIQLNGQVHSAQEWRDSGWEPGVSWLECGGFRCGCEFVNTPGAQPSGELDAVQRVLRRSTESDRFAAFLLGGDRCECGGCE